MGPATKRQRMLTHYGVLQVSEDACPEVIEAAYKRLARIYHPDNKDTGNQETFIRIKSAYDTLSDPYAREVYDRSLVSEDIQDEAPLPKQKINKVTRWTKRNTKDEIAKYTSDGLCQMIQQMGLRIGVTNLDQLFRRDIEREVKRYVRGW